MDEVRGHRGDHHNRARLGRIAAVLLIGASLAACTVAETTPSPVASPTPSNTATWTPGATPSPSPTQEPTDTPEPTLTPRPTAPRTTLPSVGPMPSGNWTGIDWIAVPGGHAPSVPADSDISGDFELFGWSGGYLEFVHKPGSTQIVPWRSSDGLHWSAAKALDPTGMKSEYGSEYAVRIRSLAEGPAGLVAAAELLQTGVACGPSEYPLQSLWISTDGGATWARVGLAAAFPRGSVYEIFGGSSGYIARGAIGDRSVFWVSADGRTWRPSDTSGSTFTDANMGSAASFSRGFVLAGQRSHRWSVRTFGRVEQVDGGAVVVGRRHGLDRDDLSGATVGDWVAMSIERINDGALYATERSGGSQETDTAWTSADGKTWTIVHGGAPVSVSQLCSNGRRGIVVTDLYGAVPGSDGVWTFEDLKPVKLTRQVGDPPFQGPVEVPGGAGSERPPAGQLRWDTLLARRPHGDGDWSARRTAALGCRSRASGRGEPTSDGLSGRLGPDG